jgi:hypothetical protein
MKTVLLAFLVACAAETPATIPGPPQHVGPDLHFSGIVPPYASPDDCVAAHSDNIHECTYEIALCLSGDAGIRTNDIVQRGTYVVDNNTAVVTLEDGTTFQLDLATGQAVDAPLASWVADDASRFDTLEWDVLDCPQPTD